MNVNITKEKIQLAKKQQQCLCYIQGTKCLLLLFLFSQVGERNAHTYTLSSLALSKSRTYTIIELYIHP